MDKRKILEKLFSKNRNDWEQALEAIEKEKDEYGRRLKSFENNLTPDQQSAYIELSGKLESNGSNFCFDRLTDDELSRLKELAELIEAGI